MSKVSQWDLGDKKMGQLIGQLWDAFTFLENRKEVQKFLSKFFTPSEIQMLAKRLELLKLADSDLEVIQLVRWLGISKVTVYEWLEKHDAYEGDFHIIIDRLKKLDERYLERLKQKMETSAPQPFNLGGELLKLGAKAAYKGYKRRAKRKSVLAGRS